MLQLLTDKKVRLLSVLGHGINLLPHFIRHYKDIVDEIYLVVYESEIAPNLNEEVKKVIKDYNNVKIIKSVKNRVFDWENVTLLYNIIKSKNPKGWWVISDIDEFHLYPKNSLYSVIDDCDKNGWEIVRGGFIDRIGKDGKFVELTEDNLIWEQYPNAGFFRYPMSKACPNKICIVKGDIEITPGQHYAKIDGQTTWKWQGWNHPLIAPYETYSVQVHHFKWDISSIDRIKAVADIKQKYAFSSEYELMYNTLKKSKFKIDLSNPDYMMEDTNGSTDYNQYKNWNKLIKKITSI